MSDKYQWQQDLIDELRRLADPVNPERATLAELRRCLSGDLGRALSRVGWLFNKVPDYALDDALLVAALFASHQNHKAGVSLGAAFRKLGDTDSVEKRFVALLDSEKEDLPGRLRQAVSLLKSNQEIPLDWEELLVNLRCWELPSHRVQRNWARDFWEEPRAELASSEAVNDPQPTA